MCLSLHVTAEDNDEDVVEASVLDDYAGQKENENEDDDAGEKENEKEECATVIATGKKRRRQPSKLIRTPYAAEQKRRYKFMCYCRTLIQVFKFVEQVFWDML